VEFDDITPERKRFPSWVVKHGRGAVVTMPRPIDLKPANLPHDLHVLEEVVKQEDSAAPPVSQHAPEMPPVPSQDERLPVPPVGASAVPDPPKEVIRYEIDEEATAQVRAAVRELGAAREFLVRETEHEVVKLAAAIARKVIARELALDPSIVEGLVREGLGALAQPDRLVVRVGLGFAAASTDLMSALANEGTELRVVVDDKLELYGCVVQAELGSVDESIETRLATLLTTLVGETDSRDG
jgi:hypothetical protein